MALGLHQAEPNRPLYIVAIQSGELRRWLTRAGIELGDAIWKSDHAGRSLSAWVKGEWGQMIISPGMAADMLVANQEGIILPLHRISVGTVGRLVGYKPSDDCRSLRDVKNIAIGSHLIVQKKIDRLVFHVRTGGNPLRIDDETAFHTWMKADGQWVQLGVFPIGRPFHPQLFTGRGNAKHMFERLKGQKAPFLTFSKIETHPAAQYASRDVFIKTQSGNVLSLTEKESKNIIVRFCDICWACGICR